MHARVVRFTDASAEQIEKVVAQVEGSDGPPPGVEATGMKLLYDESQGTAIFIALFEDAEKLRAADEVFEQMDGTDTPGTRASVDRCEVKVQRDAP